MQTILITGASSGIGAALALRYAAPDVRLILMGRNAERLQDIAHKTKAMGAFPFIISLDIKDTASVRRSIVEIDQQHPINLAILNAGISNFGVPETHARIQHIFDVNLQGTLNCLIPLLECFESRGRGQIGLMSSLASFKGFRGKAAYCASKAAIRILGEGLRESYKLKGIQISVICPGFVKTPLTDHNTFHMPFLMPASVAADYIRKGLQKNKGRISFPWPFVLGTWVMNALPQALSERLSSLLPYK